MTCLVNFVQCFFVLFGAVSVVLAGDKEFRLNQFSNCADGNDYIAKFTGPDHPDGHVNQFVLAGEMKAAHDIAGPMELHIESKKCSQTGSNCEALPTVTIDDLCGKFDDRNAFWTPFIDGTSPRLACPIKKGTYLFKNATIDLNIIKSLPLEGFQYHTAFKVTAGAAKKIIFCVDSIADIHAAKA